MSPAKTLKEMESRKRTLLAESDLHRQVLLLDAVRLEQMGEQAFDLTNRLRRCLPWLLPVVPVFGYLLGKNWKKIHSIGNRGIVLGQWIHLGWRVWQAVEKNRKT